MMNQIIWEAVGFRVCGPAVRHLRVSSRDHMVDSLEAVNLLRTKSSEKNFLFIVVFFYSSSLWTHEAELLSRLQSGGHVDTESLLYKSRLTLSSPNEFFNNVL